MRYGFLAMASTALAVGAGGTAHATVITDGDSSFTVGVNGGGSAGYVPGVVGIGFSAGGADHLFENFWSVRGPGDTSESVFGSTGTLVESGSGSLVTFTQTTIDYIAAVTYQIFDGGAAGAATVVASMSLTAITAGSYNVFSYADYDIEGSFANDSGSLFGTNQMRVTDGVTSTYMDFLGYGADALQGGIFPSLRTSLLDGGVTNLDGSGLPIVDDDVTGAFQWTNSLAADGTLTLTSVYTINEDAAMAFVPLPPAVWAGLAGLVLVVGMRRLKLV